jgi:hypothetical protein
MNALPFAALFSDLKARFDALTPRERGALALLVALGAVYLAFASFDWAQAAQRAALDVRSERSAAARAALAGRGDIFLLAVDEEAGKARTYAFTDATIHIARARLLSQLESKARLAGLEDVRLTADRSPPPRSGPQAVKATIEASYEATAYLAFLREIASAEQSLTPTLIDIREFPESRLRITLEAPYLGRNP